VDAAAATAVNVGDDVNDDEDDEDDDDNDGDRVVSGARLH